MAEPNKREWKIGQTLVDGWPFQVLADYREELLARFEAVAAGLDSGPAMALWDAIEAARKGEG